MLIGAHSRQEVSHSGRVPLPLAGRQDTPAAQVQSIPSSVPIPATRISSMTGRTSAVWRSAPRWRQRQRRCPCPPAAMPRRHDVGELLAASPGYRECRFGPRADRLSLVLSTSDRTPIVELLAPGVSAHTNFTLTNVKAILHNHSEWSQAIHLALNTSACAALQRFGPRRPRAHDRGSGLPGLWGAHSDDDWP